MKRNTLYSSLLSSLYALNGADGEFLGALAQPIRLPYGVEDGVLVEFPSTRYAELVDSIEWHREAIEEEIEMAHEDAGTFDPDATVEDLLDALDSDSLSAEYVRDLRRDLAGLEAQLAAL